MSNRKTCKVICSVFFFIIVFFVFFTTFLLLNSEFYYTNIFASFKQDNGQSALNVSSKWSKVQNLKILNYPGLKTLKNNELKALNKTELKTLNETEFKTFNENLSQNIEFFFSDSDSNFVVNNFGKNLNLILNKTRHRDVPQNYFRKILFWNDAFGEKKYSIGIGNEPFYTFKCPDTR